MKYSFGLKIILTAVVLIFSITSGILAAESNLALNPGFEDGSGDDTYYWLKNSWNTSPDVTQFNMDTGIRHSGSKSACITNRTPNDARYRQEIKAKGNTYYRLSCWIKTENVGIEKKGANLSIDGILDTSRDIRGTSNGWERVELYGITGDKQSSFTITIGLGGYGSENTGKAWFDDVAVEELNTPPEMDTVRLYTPSPNAAASGSSSKFLFVGLLAFFIILAVSIAYTLIKDRKASSHLRGEVPHRHGNKNDYHRNEKEQDAIPLLDKKDVTVMLGMTFLYLILALYNLGGLNSPKTWWQPENPGESVTIDFGREIDISRVYYYVGLIERRYEGSKYRLEYKDSSGSFQPLAAITMMDPSNIPDFYKWKYINVSARAKAIRIISDVPGGIINEFGFFEPGSKKPVEGFNITDKMTDPKDSGKVENWFDEQDTIEYSPSFKTSTYFDEIYHARTAFESLNRIEPYETTHPPLGKLFIALGIMVFGMDPFGWRIVGTLFGAAMIPLMYMFGMKIFHKRFYAFSSAFLMMFDYMHFSQTRIATIDVYGTFFVILMYYFMYDYFVKGSYNLGFKESLKPLFLSGLFFGFGAASKWIGIYAGAGLAFLFFTAKLIEYLQYRKLRMLPEGKRPAWVDVFIRKYVLLTGLYCVLFFVVIPAAIYILSYIPFMLVPGPGHDLAGVWRNQLDMFNYHSTLKATHSFSSSWLEWPIMRKPIWYYGGSDLPEGLASSIVSMGNPAVWWTGIPAFFTAIIIAILKRDKKVVPFITAAIFQYVPWAFITRLAFIYHFFSTVPFLILSIVYIIREMTETHPGMRHTAYAYLGVVAVLFVMFYPILSGMIVPKSYIEHLRWFSTWYFTY